MKLTVDLITPEPPDERGYERETLAAKLVVEVPDILAWAIYAEVLRLVNDPPQEVRG